MFRTTLMSVQAQRLVACHLRRNFGVSAPAAQATDPIQKLFLDKIKEYTQKSKSAEGGLVDANANVVKTLNDELAKIKRVYGANSPDFMNFPTFSFADSKLDAVGVDASAKEEEVALQEEAIEDLEQEDPHKTYWQP